MTIELPTASNSEIYDAIKTAVAELAREKNVSDFHLLGAIAVIKLEIECSINRAYSAALTRHYSAVETDNSATGDDHAN